VQRRVVLGRARYKSAWHKPLATSESPALSRRASRAEQKNARPLAPDASVRGFDVYPTGAFPAQNTWRRPRGFNPARQRFAASS